LLFSKTWADAFIKGSNKHRTFNEQNAQCVLDARAQHASSSLANLYDPLTMPPALLKAHQKLDATVDVDYQPSSGKKSHASDAERVAFLFELYQRITSLMPIVPTKKKTTFICSRITRGKDNEMDRGHRINGRAFCMYLAGWADGFMSNHYPRATAARHLLHSFRGRRWVYLLPARCLPQFGRS
jgi:hypothetical protein